MEQDQIRGLLAAQRARFACGDTLPLAARKQLLGSLLAWTRGHQQEICAALAADLNKSETEVYLTEIGLVLEEGQGLLRHLERWASPRRVRTPLALFPARCCVHSQPYGTVLIMSPWNYPFQLSLVPLLGALAAGNTVLLKPSAYAPATARLLAKMLAECAEPSWATVVEGGRAENACLLEERFDYIFFTGSVAVGRLVMAKAAAHLTPLTLELGGKSPVIVDRTADLRQAARRILFGKSLNAGQTCIAPDYLLVQREIKPQLVAELARAYAEFYPQGALADPGWPRMINDKHWQRVRGLMQGEAPLLGGGADAQRLLIEPTLVEISWARADSAPCMGEEIFGPLLPLICYDRLEQAMQFVAARPHPLALYLFTTDKQVEQQVLRGLSFGGGCVNDTIMHLATTRLPFGGVGESGLGSYHGKASFDTFTHYKSVVHKPASHDLPLRYPPYSDAKKRLIRRFLG